MTDVPAASQTPAGFPSQTAWSVILGLKDRDSPEWKSRFELLVSRYWKPVCWFLVRRWRLGFPDAADLTQEFFLKLYDRDLLQGASPERGRFRTFLKLSLRNLVVEELRRKSAQKRGGDLKRVAIPMDGTDAAREPAWEGLSPEEAFDRDWASCLLGHSLRDLESDLRAQGKEATYEAFRLCAVDHPRASYGDAAAHLGVKEGDVANFVFRARAQLREIVRRLARESVESESDVDDEVASLFKIFEG